MSYPFQPNQGPILIKAEVTGPARSMPLQLILDTGATSSLLDRSVLVALGFDLSQVTTFVQMTTGSGFESVPRVVLTRFTTLGQHRFGFPVLAHALPASAQVFGLLGLDFLRGFDLRINFKTGQIDLL